MLVSYSDFPKKIQYLISKAVLDENPFDQKSKALQADWFSISCINSRSSQQNNYIRKKDSQKYKAFSFPGPEKTTDLEQ